MIDWDKVMRSRCIQLFVLNILDTLITLYAITQFPDFYVEANPLMDAVIGASPAFFASFKILLGTGLFWMLYLRRRAAVARSGAAFCLAIYWCIVIYNVLLFATVQDVFSV